jgi:RNA polymerase sigma-70 factor (ECF subfamily)
MDDAQAIRCMKRGEIAGLESLIAHYQVKAIRTAFLITHDEPMAEDVVQDVFVRVFQRIQHFDENRSFEPYLMRSVVNAALNAVQKESKWARHSTDTDTCTLEDLLSRATLVENQVEFAQIKLNILAALSKLPPRQRVVIVQRYYLEMSEKEMAEELDAAPGTIKWLLSTARTRLRSLLSSERNAE